MRVLKLTTQLLATLLNQEELTARALELAKTVQDTGAEVELQKSLKDQMKAKLSELGAKTTRLSQVVSSGHEYRSTEVEVRMADNGQVQEVRLDTGEIIVTRPPYNYERQPPLEPVEPEAFEFADPRP